MSQKKTLPNWNSTRQSEKEVLKSLKEGPSLYGRYFQMDEEWRQKFMDFCCGKKTLPLTYDPFFKLIFHPDIHPERLSQLISSLLGVKVKVKGILPSEDSMMDGESLLILDILVELEDGTLSNIEIQKIPYTFPAERMSCYSSDLIMRQYTRTKGEKGRHFTYRDMKKVYTIVLFEKSISAFHREPGVYIHYGKNTFDTGLELELLQEYCLIALDVFRESPYPKERSERTAWLSLLATEDIEKAERLIKEYPWLEEIYREAAEMRKNPKEVLGMYSEALRTLDRNTVRYMIEEQEKEIKQQKLLIAEKERQLEEKDVALEEKNTLLEQQSRENAELRKKLEQLQTEKA